MSRKKRKNQTRRTSKGAVDERSLSLIRQLRKYQSIEERSQEKGYPGKKLGNVKNAIASEIFISSIKVPPAKMTDGTKNFLIIYGPLNREDTISFKNGSFSV
ncbi:MAG: hypothetical protein RSD63_04845 [Eubacterium sp.]